MRVLLLLLGSAGFIAPADAQQQQPGKVYRIGYLREGQPAKSLFEAFQQGLRERGYVEGRNVVIESRLGSLDQLPQLAKSWCD